MAGGRADCSRPLVGMDKKSQLTDLQVTGSFA
jgi:hypothetical protein